MNKKKGFTLVELIVTIALLGLIGSIIAVNMVGLYKKQDQSETARIESIIKSAAETYLEVEQKSGCVSVEELIKQNYLKEKEIKDYKDKYVEIVNGELTIKSDQECNSDTKYLKVTYKSNLKDEMVQNLPIDNTKYKKGDYVTLNQAVPTTNGYNFVGWSKKENGNILTDSNTKITKNLNLYAIWTKKNFNVTYDLNGGTSPNINTASVAYKDSYTITSEEPVKAGYVFKGWRQNDNYSSNETDINYKPNDKITVTKNITLKAIYEPGVYTITLDNQNANVAGSKSLVEYYNSRICTDKNICNTSQVTIERPSKTGYKFKGYYTKKNGLGEQLIDENGKTKFINTAITSNTTLYAYYEINKYQVIINEIYDQTISTTQTINYNDSVTKTISPKEGYEYSKIVCNGTSSYSFKNNVLNISNIKNNITCNITYIKQIFNVKVIAENGYLYNSKTLKESIINDNEIKTNADIGSATTSSDQAGLFKTTVDNSTIYYYRGNVDNNNLNFAGLKWKIVRTNEDGSIKLILNSVLNEKVVKSDVNEVLNEFYNNYLQQYSANIIDNYFCGDKYSGNYSLSCKNKLSVSNNNLSNPIGMLTAQEAVYAGLPSNYKNIISWKISTTNYYLKDSYTWWTNNGTDSDQQYLTVYYYEKYRKNFFDIKGASLGAQIRPVVNIDGNLQIKGNGTENDPYRLENAVDASIDNTNPKKVLKTKNASFNVTSNYNYEYSNVVCTNDQSASYDNSTKLLNVKNVTNDTECKVTFSNTKYVIFYVPNENYSSYKTTVDKIISNYKTKGVNLKVDIVPHDSYKIKMFELNTNRPSSMLEFGAQMPQFLGIIGKYALFSLRIVSPSGSTHADGYDQIYLRRYNDTYDDPSGLLCILRKEYSYTNNYYISKDSKEVYVKSGTTGDSCYIYRNGEAATSISNISISSKDLQSNYNETSVFLNNSKVYDPYYNTDSCNQNEMNYLNSNVNNYLSTINGIWKIYKHNVSDGNKCGLIVQNEKERNNFKTYSLWYDENSGSDQKVSNYYNDSENISKRYKVFIKIKEDPVIDNDNYGKNYTTQTTLTQTTSQNPLGYDKLIKILESMKISE